MNEPAQPAPGSPVPRITTGLAVPIERFFEPPGGSSQAGSSPSGTADELPTAAGAHVDVNDLAVDGSFDSHRLDQPFDEPGLDAAGDEIEEAYRRALEATELAWEAAGQEPPEELQEPLISATVAAPNGVLTDHAQAAETQLDSASTFEAGSPQSAEAELSPTNEASAEPSVADSVAQEAVGSSVAALKSTGAAGTARAAVADSKAGGRTHGLRIAGSPTGAEADSSQAISPTQVLEAALFVGGGPLTGRKLASVLFGQMNVAAVETLIDELNQRYADEGRPYEIRLGDGGYQMVLRREYEKVRHKVYGMGPREVKLSQDALEVLALVAYKQPITVPEIEACGKPNASALLRQLLRRDLVALARDEDEERTIRYHTTERFLSVFGVGSLDELPTPDDLALK